MESCEFDWVHVASKISYHIDQPTYVLAQNISWTTLINASSL